MVEQDQSKLLYLMNHYAPGGATHFTHVLPLLNEIARQGATVKLVIEKADVKPTGLDSSIECVVLPASGRLMRSLALFREVRRSAKEGYHSIFVRIAAWSALTAIAASFATRAKVFFWLSGTTIEFDRAQPWSVAKCRWFITSRFPSRAASRLCHKFVTGPEPMLDYYERVGRVPRRKLALLYNDVHLPRFEFTSHEREQARKDLRNRLKLDPASTIILFVHRLSPVRRTLDYLPGALVRLRALGLTGNTVLVVAGGGGDLSELKSRCRSAGLDEHVRFVGEASNDGIEFLYAATDVFIQPSHAEGFPRVLLEAMASGLPIVTTAAGGSGTVLGGLQQKYVTDPDRPEEFANALALLMGSRDEWPLLSQENLNEVQRFATPVVAAMYRKVLFS